MRKRIRLKKLMTAALALALLTAFTLPFAAAAEEAEQKVVRVGWFDSSFCYRDQFGRRCGVDYEYQHKISAYTGWTYEYVEDSWPNLLQKLIDGQIDLLSDVSYKPEREEFILYPDLPMGSETYYIYIDGENREITADNPASFNGKRIGVNQGSVQEGFLREWAEKNGVSLEILLLTTEEDESMNMVTRGQIDGFASIYSYGSEQRVVPSCRIGASDYYYAVNRNRPDLLAELNAALAGIHEEDPNFNEKVSERLLYNEKMNILLTPDQEDWLAKHGAVRVGYVENYMPFCGTDSETAELTGALRDFLTHAQNNLRDSEIRFETKAYATTSEALAALKNGEVDCAFPVYMSTYDCDELGIRLTNAAMKTGMNAITRGSDSQNLSRDSELTFAVSAGNPNVETFMMDEYPGCRRLTFPNEKACFDAVASGLADCLLISNYQISEFDETIRENKFYSVPTGEHIPLSFAVKQADRELYFLLNKTVLTTKSEDMDSALTSYMHTSQGVTFGQFLRDHWIIVLISVSAVFLIIVFLLLKQMKAQRKAHEQERLLEEAAEIADLKETISSLLDNMPGMSFTKDANTGAYLACNQAFADYAGRKEPNDVIGHTDTELFDAETAKRLAEDDRMALAMEEPYIYFEEAQDDDGKQRQIKTTKLKYTDATGRLCVMGIFQDVTDSLRIRRTTAATRESYERAKGTGVMYAHIAQALARGYTELYYIDLNTEEYIKYRPDTENGGLTEARRGWHFFEECQDEIDENVYPDDREALKRALDRRTLVEALNQNNTFMTVYRLIGEKEQVYVNMTVTRIADDERYIVLGIRDIDEQVKQRSAAARVKEERIAYNRLNALAGDYMCVYIVDPEKGQYREISETADYAFFGQAKEGTDFFSTTREAAREFSHPEDLNRFLSAFTKENILAEIGHRGMFTVSYRLMMRGKPHYVQLKAVIVDEPDGNRMIVGINDIDNQVRQEEAYVDHLAKAQIEANVDALTGVKNRHAYLMSEERLNLQIADNDALAFAVVILDVNDLKRVNDSEGHNAGDQYLRDACRIICNTFKHSPVFRVGGDEFTVIAQGEDYARIDELVGQMNSRNEEALRTGGIVIACGMAKREKDESVAPVFERADQMMYENKNNLKNR